MNEYKVFVCKHCGKIIEVFPNTHCCPTMCCGEPMVELKANTTDAATEKHVPVYKRVEDEIAVKVGEVEHPMEKDHYIMWIAQVSDNQTTRIRLYPEQSTEVRFKYIPGSILYAYCNKHGLWKAEVK